MPQRFTAHRGEIFTLTETQQGSEEAEFRKTDEELGEELPLPMRDGKTPLIAHDETDPGPFDVQGAHEEARIRSEAYRQFFEQHADAVVAQSRLSLDGRATHVGGIERDTWKRSLFATAPSGDAIQVWITKADGPVPVYEVSEVHEGEIDAELEPDMFPSKLSQLGASIQLSENLTQLPVNRGTGWGLWLSMSSDHNTYLTDHLAVPTGDPIVFIFHEEPGQKPPEESGTTIIKPGYTLLDGSTGELILFERHKRDLPFDGRYIT